MRDIKSLYLEAKRTGSQRAIDHYMEAVNDLINNDPLGYISNLEYIISSSSGLQTLKEFVEKNGMPLTCVDTLEECLEKCIHKCEVAEKDSSSYKKVLESVQDARRLYDESFSMFEYYKEDIPNNYVSTYYGKNSNGIPNRKLLAGMISKFGEACIPDMMLTAKSLGESALITALNYISTQYIPAHPNNRVVAQWIKESVKDLSITDAMYESFSRIYDSSLDKVISDMRNRNRKIYQESVIMGNDNAMMEYSEDEIRAIEDLISFKEYRMASTPDPAVAFRYQQEAFSLYEELDGLIPDNQELLTEKADVKTVAAKKIASNMKALAVKIKNAVGPAVRKAVYDANFDRNEYSKVANPSVRVTFGNKKGPYTFGTLGMKGKVKKNLNEIIDFSSEWIKGIVIYIDFTTDTEDPILGAFSEYHWKVFMKGVKKGLKDLIKDGIVSLTANEPDNYEYTSYIKTWRVPVYMSKSNVIEDVDLDFDESSSEFMEMIANSVIPMLPGEGHDIMEAQWQYNTMNKKTGDIPGYLKNNHDLGYGEEDPPKKEEPKDTEYTLDDFRRPSASVDPEPAKPEEPEEEPESDKPTSGVNNYYYYTYNNSLNRNQGSFNRSHSVRDDHSTRTIRDDHSTGKRVNSDDINSHNSNHIKPEEPEEEPESEDNSDETVTELSDTYIDYDFNEASNYYIDEDAYDGHIKKVWFIKSDNGVDNCCVSVTGYAHPMRGRSIMITLKKINDEWCALIKRKPNGQWEFPGGGWDRGETPRDAGIRELNEEAQVNVKNVKRLGTQIQYNSMKAGVSLWVKQHVKDSRDWWYGYYTAIFIGEEDGKFTGHIEEEDYEDTFRWKPISFIAKKLSHKIINAIEDHIQREFKNPLYHEHLSDEEFERLMKDKSPDDIRHDITAVQEEIDQVSSSGDSKKKKGLLAILRENLKRLTDWLVRIVRSAGQSLGLVKETNESSLTVVESASYIQTLEDFHEISLFIIEKTGINPFSSDEYLLEAVDVTSKKFNKAYKAAFNYENGHLIKITYSLQGCEVTNVGLSKAMRDHFASVAEEVNKENHRGAGLSKNIRAFLVMMKGLIRYNKHVNDRKKLLTNYLNKNIGDVGYLDFQAKGCKIIGLYDLYTGKEITGEIPIVGVYAARHMDTGKAKILSDKDLAAVHKKLESGKTKFHVSNHKVGDMEPYPTFMSTYWNDKDDHLIIDMSGKVIDSDERDKSPNAGLDNIPDLIGDLEMKGFHVSDEEAAAWLTRYRSTEKWIPDTISVDVEKEKEKKGSSEDKTKSTNLTEAVGDADDNKPESDHPVKDVLTDIDRNLVSKQQKAKKAVQDVQNVGRAFMKPVNRTSQWIGNMINKWKDVDENNIKERMADPHARNNIFTAAGSAIKYGSLLKAGLLLNPVFLYLTVTKAVGRNQKEFRIRNEMIKELKTELEIIDEKIKDARAAGDNKAKYQLMRLKNEINKKLLRVGGDKQWKKII